MTAKEVNQLIQAGFQANVESIEYNGIKIKYRSQAPVAAPDAPPIFTPHPTTPADESESQISARAEALANDQMEELMHLNPLEFEERIGLEGANGN